MWKDSAKVLHIILLHDSMSTVTTGEIMHKIGLVVTEFHKKESDEMVAAVKKFASNNELEIVKEVRIPGCLEAPLALKRLLLDDAIEGCVVLGIIEKGGTKHGFVMSNAVMEGIIDLQLDLMKPIGVGILGPEIEPDQIPSRVEPYATDAIKALKTMLTND